MVQPSPPPPFLSPLPCSVQNTRPLPTLPGDSTGYAIISAGPVGITYSVFSSGDRMTPFGRVRSSISRVTLPSVAM